MERFTVFCDTPDAVAQLRIAGLDTVTDARPPVSQQRNNFESDEPHQVEKRDPDSIQYVYCHGCALSNLLSIRWVFALPQLTILDVSGNQLKSLGFTTMWAQLSNLKYLYLHQNNISDVHVIIDPLRLVPSLRLLTVHGNPAAITGCRPALIDALPQLRVIDEHIVADIERLKFAPYFQPVARFSAFSRTTHIGGRLSIVPSLELSGAQEYDRRLLLYLSRQVATALPSVEIQRVWRGARARRKLFAPQQPVAQDPAAASVSKRRRRRQLSPSASFGLAHSQFGSLSTMMMSVSDALNVVKRAVRRWLQREQLVAAAIMDCDDARSIVVYKKDLPHWCAMALRAARVEAARGVVATMTNPAAFDAVYHSGGLSRRDSSVGLKSAAPHVNLSDVITVMESPLRLLRHHPHALVSEVIGFPVPRLHSSQLVLTTEPAVKDEAALPRVVGPLTHFCRSRGVDDTVAINIRQRASLAAQNAAERRRGRAVVFPLEPVATIIVHDTKVMARLLNCAKIYNTMRRHAPSLMTPYYLAVDADRIAAAVNIQAVWRGHAVRTNRRVALRGTRIFAILYRQRLGVSASKSLGTGGKKGSKIDHANPMVKDFTMDPEYRIFRPTLAFHAARLQAVWRGLLARRRAHFLRQLRAIPLHVDRGSEPGIAATTVYMSASSLLQLLPPPTPVVGQPHDQDLSGSCKFLMGITEVPPTVPSGVRVDEHCERLALLHFPEIAALRHGLELGTRLNTIALSSRQAPASIQGGVIFCGGSERFNKLPVYLRSMVNPTAEFKAALLRSPLDVLLHGTELLHFAPFGSLAAPKSAISAFGEQAADNASLAVSMTQSAATSGVAPYMAVAPYDDLLRMNRFHVDATGRPITQQASTVSTFARSVRSRRRLDRNDPSGTSRKTAGGTTPAQIASLGPTDGTIEERCSWISQLAQAYPNGYLALRFSSRKEAVSRRFALAALTFDVTDGSAIVFEPRKTLMQTAAVARLSNWWRIAKVARRQRQAHDQQMHAQAQLVASVAPLSTDASLKGSQSIGHPLRSENSQSTLRSQNTAALVGSDAGIDASDQGPCERIGAVFTRGDTIPALTQFDLSGTARRPNSARQGRPMTASTTRSEPGTGVPRHNGATSVAEDDDPTVVGYGVALRPAPPPSLEHVARAAHHDRLVTTQARDAAAEAAREQASRCRNARQQRHRPQAKISQQLVTMELLADPASATARDSRPLVLQQQQSFSAGLDSSSRVTLGPARVGQGTIVRPSAAGPFHSHAVLHYLEIPSAEIAPGWAVQGRNATSQSTAGSNMAVATEGNGSLLPSDVCFIADTVTDASAATPTPVSLVSPTRMPSAAAASSMVITNMYRSTGALNVDRAGDATPTTAAAEQQTTVSIADIRRAARDQTRAMQQAEWRLQAEETRRQLESQRNEVELTRAAVQARRNRAVTQHRVVKALHMAHVEPTADYRRLERDLANAAVSAKQAKALEELRATKLARAEREATVFQARDVHIKARYPTPHISTASPGSQALSPAATDATGAVVSRSLQEQLLATPTKQALPMDEAAAPSSMQRNFAANGDDVATMGNRQETPKSLLNFPPPLQFNDLVSATQPTRPHSARVTSATKASAAAATKLRPVPPQSARPSRPKPGLGSLNVMEPTAKASILTGSAVRPAACLSTPSVTPRSRAAIDDFDFIAPGPASRLGGWDTPTRNHGGL
jgi:hypothetical protein